MLTFTWRGVMYKVNGEHAKQRLSDFEYLVETRQYDLLDMRITNAVATKVLEKI